jgi:type IV pilus assembly protein PilA
LIRIRLLVKIFLRNIITEAVMRANNMNKNKESNRGFTLSELLIVVAIIAVLVAIAIPIFTRQLEKSREATDIANVREAYATVMTEYLDDMSHSYEMSVEARQTVPGWQGPSGVIVGQLDGEEVELDYEAVVSGSKYLVGISTTESGDPMYLVTSVN